MKICSHGIMKKSKQDYLDSDIYLKTSLPCHLTQNATMQLKKHYWKSTIINPAVKTFIKLTHTLKAAYS